MNKVAEGIQSNRTLQDVAYLCSERMEEIARCFKTGAQVTLIVRSPGFPDRDFMLTNDSLLEVVRLVRRLDKRFKEITKDKASENATH